MKATQKLCGDSRRSAASGRMLNSERLHEIRPKRRRGTGPLLRTRVRSSGLGAGCARGAAGRRPLALAVAGCQAAGTPATENSAPSHSAGVPTATRGKSHASCSQCLRIFRNSRRSAVFRKSPQTPQFSGRRPILHGSPQSLRNNRHADFPTRTPKNFCPSSAQYP